MTGQELVQIISKQIADAGYKQEIYAIGPAGLPIPIQALLPVGFRAIINLIPNEQSNINGTIHQRQPTTSNWPDAK